MTHHLTNFLDHLQVKVEHARNMLKSLYQVGRICGYVYVDVDVDTCVNTGKIFKKTTLKMKTTICIC